MTAQPLPPLPLVGPPDDQWLFVDNTFVEQLFHCYRSAEYFKLHARIINAPSPALNFGTCIHSGMEARYSHLKGCHAFDGEVEQSMFDAMAKHLLENPQEGDDYRDLSFAIQMVQAYNRVNISEVFDVCETSEGKKAVELPFATSLLGDDGLAHQFQYYQGKPLTEQPWRKIRVMYTGRIDLIISQFSQLFTLDWKTTFQLGDSFWNAQKMSGQHIGYVWSAEQILKQQISGYIIRAFCTRKMSKSRPEHDKDDFPSQVFYVSEDRKQEWRRNTIQVIQNFLDAYSTGFLAQNYKNCIGKYGACQFYEVCSLPELSRLTYLQSDLFKANEWSPLNKEKKQETKQPMESE